MFSHTVSDFDIFLLSLNIVYGLFYMFDVEKKSREKRIFFRKRFEPMDENQSSQEQ